MKNVNKAICCLLVSVLLLLCCSAAFSEGDAESPAAEEYIPYREVDGYSSGEYGFIWSDEMLFTNSSSMSGDLAKVAASLATAAYQEGDILNALNRMLEENDEENNALLDVGSYDYTSRSLDDCDKVAYAIGSKKRPDGKMIYIVAIRGTVGCEWFSNFNVQNDDWDDSEHAGFHLAANRVISRLSGMIANDGVSDGNTYMLFCGHSRGAAVANIAAAHFSRGGGIPTSQVFGYTFACPAVRIMSNSSAASYTNIFNFNNTGDAVPQVPLEDWGYRCYGIDQPLYISEMPRFDANYYYEFEETNSTGFTNYSYVEFIKALFPDVDKLNEPVGHLICMAIAYKMNMSDSQGDNVTLYDFVKKYAKDMVTESFLEKLVAKYTLKHLFDQILDDYGIMGEIVDFLSDAVVQWCDNEDYSLEDFEQWLEDNSETITHIFVITGVRIVVPQNILLALTSLGEWVENFKRIGTGIGALIDIFENSNSANPLDDILDAHKKETYLIAINTKYFGYNAYYQSSDSYKHPAIPINVKTIGKNCFRQSNIETVSGMEHVRFMGSNAFTDCASLTEISLDVVQEIGEGMFADCTSLTSVNLGTRVKIIGESAFNNCCSLESLYIPDSVETIVTDDYSNGPFSLCTGLKTISIGGVEILKSGMLSTGSRNLETLTIRGTVRQIDDYALSSSGFNSNEWNGYQISEETETANADLILEEGIETIGEKAFFFCTMFKSISLPSTLTEIGERAFEYCSGAIAIHPDNRIGSIGYYAFGFCPGLERLSLKKIETVGEEAFYGCTGLKQINIGNSMASIGKNAFNDCDAIDFAVFAGSETAWSAVEVSLGNDALLSTMFFLQEPDFHLPEMLTAIGKEAFCGIKAVSIEIPATVTAIGDRAFASCTELKQIIIPAGVTEIGDEVFDGCGRVLIVGASGSCAQQYADSLGYPFLAQ